MSKKIKVAAAQLSPIFLDKKKTVEKACKAILDAGKKKANLIVFPEAFVPGYPDWVWLLANNENALSNSLYSQLLANSVTIGDTATVSLCKAAKEAHINVVIGINERNAERSGKSIYNTLLFINNQGKILGKHRKMIPTGGERLVWAQGDGSTLQSYDTSVGRIAGLICWENFMPLARTALYEQGIEILMAPTWDQSNNWLQTMQSIAREGGMFVMSVCMALKIDDIPERYEFSRRYPADRVWINKGNSIIISPKGELLAGPLEAEEAILFAEIDFTEISEAKRLFDVAGHYSRPDVFRLTINSQENNSN